MPVFLVAPKSVILRHLPDLHSLDVVRWEDSLPVAYAASPPVGLVLCALDNCDDFALLETQIARLVGIECEFGYGLTGSSTDILRAESWLGCAWPAGRRSLSV